MKNYVKKYKGHDVPEGAEEFGCKSDFYPQDSFYKNAGSKVFVLGEWEGTASNRKDLIQLPEQPMPSKAEWNGEGLPPENIQCLFECAPLFGRNNKQVCITGTAFTSIDGPKILCEVDGEWMDGFESQFYPLKTAEEKKREAFIERSMNLIETMYSTIEAQSLATEMAGLQFDGGFTAPEGEL